jgi:YesN/AraC family two-component response regulator
VGDGSRQDSIAVLLVDDLMWYRRALASMIDLTEGFEVVGQVGSGEEAIAFLERQPVELVLMDVTMPGIGGLRAAQIMRERFPDVRVLLLSIYEAESVFRAARAAGVEFCPKEQFGPDQLEILWQDGRHARF